MSSEPHNDDTRRPRRINGGAAAPGLLQTSNLHSDPRFSYAETPVQVQPAVFQQFSSPTNSTIDESPIDFSPQQQNRREIQKDEDQSLYTVEKQPPNRVHSPYSISTPVQPHPALSAPYADAQTPIEPSAPLPYYINGRSTPVLAQQEASDYQFSNTQSAIPIQGADKDRKDEIRNTSLPERTLTYNPYSPAGPNVSLANHRPGQVAHPNSEVDPKWKHGMCEADSLCCIGLFCPCMVYGKTQYRLAQKAKKREPTDLLGYEAMNGACGLMAVACGFQCKTLLWAAW